VLAWLERGLTHIMYATRHRTRLAARARPPSPLPGVNTFFGRAAALISATNNVANIAKVRQGRAHGLIEGPAQPAANALPAHRQRQARSKQAQASLAHNALLATRCPGLAPCLSRS
jgi:hypothetical protein